MAKANMYNKTSKFETQFIKDQNEGKGEMKDMFVKDHNQAVMTSKDDEGSQKGTGFTERWGWWSTLDNLTNSRIDKWDEILNWDITKALNIVSYYSDKQKMEQQAQREMKQKYKHR